MAKLWSSHLIYSPTYLWPTYKLWSPLGKPIPRRLYDMVNDQLMHSTLLHQQQQQNNPMFSFHTVACCAWADHCPIWYASNILKNQTIRSSHKKLLQPLIFISSTLSSNLLTRPDPFPPIVEQKRAFQRKSTVHLLCQFIYQNTLEMLCPLLRWHA